MDIIDYDNLFEEIPNEEWESQSSSFNDEILQLADDNIINNLPILDQLQPPAPVFLNNLETQENKAIYFKNTKLLKDFVKSNKDLSEQYLVLLPLCSIGQIRFDPRRRPFPALLYKKHLIK